MKSNHQYDTKDFDAINWHDCKIYGLAFDEVEFKFYLDIDLIIEWIRPLSKEEGYLFKVVPATLIFNNVWNLVLDIDTNLGLDIDSVSMENPHEPKNIEYVKDKKEFDWNIILQQGEISFNSTGFELYFRKLPEIINNQYLGLKDRGGVSFSVTK